MKRIPELDALRGLAALCVLVYHLRPVDYRFGTTNLGEAAVNLFLVLSGYLITTIILEHQDQPGFLGRFYLRRGLRTWPIYYLALAVLVAINPWLPKPYSTKGLWYYVVYLQNIALGWPPRTHFNPAFDHTWSLAVEEQFYLIWPILLARAGRKGFYPLVAGTVIVAVMARAEGWHPWLLASRIDGFAIGGLLAGLLLDAERAALAACRISTLTFAAAMVVGAAGLLATLGASFTTDLLFINLVYFGLVGLDDRGLGTSPAESVRRGPLR